jgi:hypothetical protein
MSHQLKGIEKESCGAIRTQIWDDLMKGRSQTPPIIDGNTKRSEKENTLLPQGSIEESQRSAEWWEKCRVSHDLGQSNPISQRHICIGE